MKKLFVGIFISSLFLSNIYTAKVLGSTYRDDSKEIAVQCDSGMLITIFNYLSNNAYGTSGKLFDTLEEAINYGCSH